MKITTTIITLGALLASFTAGAAPKKAVIVTDKVAEQINAAVPDKAPAQPKKARKILVFHKCEGFVHACIPIGNAAMKALGEKTGAYKADFSNDMAVFTPENLKQYDAIIFNNSTQLKFENPAHRQTVMDFVKNGKGIIGIHAATDNFPTWPEAQEMMGGCFDGHPWNAGGTWAVKIDDPKHPLNKSFDGKGFKINDEIYQIKGAYSREKFRVLLSLDMTDPVTAAVGGQKRADKDYGISWIRPYGKGRVFYCSFGHNNHVYWNPAILPHYLAGIQYALGDLKADDSPSTKK